MGQALRPRPLHRLLLLDHSLADHLNEDVSLMIS